MSWMWLGVELQSDKITAGVMGTRKQGILFNTDVDVMVEYATELYASLPLTSFYAISLDHKI